MMWGSDRFKLAGPGHRFEQNCRIESVGVTEAALEQIADRHDREVRVKLLRQTGALVAQNLRQRLSNISESDDGEVVFHVVSCGECVGNGGRRSLQNYNGGQGRARRSRG